MLSAYYACCHIFKMHSENLPLLRQTIWTLISLLPWERSDLGSYCLFDLILYVTVNTFSVMSGWVFLGWTSTRQKIKCPSQRHNAEPPVRLKPATHWYRVKQSTNELPLSLGSYCFLYVLLKFVSKCSRHHLLWMAGKGSSTEFNPLLHWLFLDQDIIFYF